MSKDSTTTVDADSTDPYANTDAPVEDSATPEEEVKNPTMLYYTWGVLHVWMYVLGFLIWGYYPGLMSSSTWWKVQCPATNWTSTSYNAAINAKTICSFTTATPTCPTIVLDTNNAAAAPAYIMGWTLA
jgi:hypothetical protein